MNRKEAAEYVGITVKQLDGYRIRYTLPSKTLWNGRSWKHYYQTKDLDLLKIQIQRRQARRTPHETILHPVEDLQSNFQEMVARYCY